MANRTETAERKAALLNDLRATYHRSDGGSTALSQRALCLRYDLSAPTISQLLRQLVQEGVLYTVPRVGTFMGQPPMKGSDLYLLVSPVSRGSHVMMDQVQNGFEDRIAQLGGASYAMTADDAVALWRQGEIPNLSGHFMLDGSLSRSLEGLDFGGVPGVIYSGMAIHEPGSETVDFDHQAGGSHAAQHLLQVGHRQIAFLALHGTHGEAGPFHWSLQRESGWRQMMCSAGQDPEPLTFRPRVTPNVASAEQTAVARQISIEILRRPEITAIIAVNVHALLGLIQALQAARTPKERWPAIVCFDETPKSRAAGVSYLRLPWEKIGAEAAQLLWDRKHGRLTGPAQQRLVKMHLIPRLTCRPEWARAAGTLQQRVAGMAAGQEF